jgi:hypothetical protein
MTTERAFLGVWIPKEIYLHKGLTPTEKLLMAEITSFSKNGVCFASNEHFSEFLGVSKNHVSKLITKLSRLNLIKVKLIYKKGTKEVDKRVIYPICINDDTPNHTGVDPLIIEDYTPNHTGVDPIGVDDYYKEHIKEQDKEQDKDKKIYKKENSPAIVSEFEDLWKLYPRKIGKKKAFDSFKKARKIKKIPYEIIENGLYRYIRYLEQQGTDEQYIMHGSTWFNQEKWQDEYILTGIQQKPKDIAEYFRRKHANGGDYFEYNRNGEIIDHNPEVVSDFFQGF